ncbi:hypothetical protein DPEC_G00303100 [Dallia pectoralis]|uniref:Uncharacterized protein n=1 Tax=Dallia pectoralis TaxID=75939 RepID=A0ACC2FH52_DALPE|nr:hypothetical protein DPEC_G00303100 [Dallia pectoralis]
MTPPPAANLPELSQTPFPLPEVYAGISGYPQPKAGRPRPFPRAIWKELQASQPTSEPPVTTTGHHIVV